MHFAHLGSLQDGDEGSPSTYRVTTQVAKPEDTGNKPKVNDYD